LNSDHSKPQLQNDFEKVRGGSRFEMTALKIPPHPCPSGFISGLSLLNGIDSAKP
jgi:hypothetical protein